MVTQYIWYLTCSIIWLQLHSSSSSRMHAMNHNWSATKQRLHPQSVVEIRRHSSFVRGQDLTMWNIIWVLPQGHRSVSVSRHFLLQAPQCPCTVRKRFSRDHCCRGRLKPGCWIVASHTRWEWTTWADFQLSLHQLLMSTGCKSIKTLKQCKTKTKCNEQPLQNGNHKICQNWNKTEFI